MRNTETVFKNIFDKTIELCQENEIEVIPIKKRKISTKLNGSNTQYFMSSKEDEMRVSVYFSTLDQMISGINIRFNQGTMNMIKSVGSLLILKVDNNDIFVLSAAFDISPGILEAEIKLLQNTVNKPEGR